MPWPPSFSELFAELFVQDQRAQHGKPDSVVGGDDQPGTGDGWTGRYGVAERPVLLRRPGNAGGGKGPDFWRAFEGAEDR